MLFAGIDGSKRVVVDYSILKKRWKISKKGGGKEIFVIPSDKVLIKRERIPEGIGNEKQLRKYLKLKYSEYLFDISVEGDFYTLVLVRDFQPPKEFLALDPEPFSLARLSRLCGEENLTILDLGRRKTTLVVVRDGKLNLYRVVQKGGDFITERVAEELNLSFDEAERIKIEKGLKLEAVKKALREILKNLPPVNGRVLTTGGGAELKGLCDFLGSEPADCDLGVPKTHASALGAALKFVYEDNPPTFAKVSLSKGELKLLLYSAAILLLSTAVAVKGLNFVVDRYADFLRAKEKELFAAKFPDLPPIAVEEQLLTMQPKGRRDEVFKLLGRALKELPKGSKIFEIAYSDGSLRIKGETTKVDFKKLKVLTLKDEGNGRYLFEVEVK
jgi:hypothetical protein